jgi:two-component system chemotaxis sensor kinase CheA
MVDFSAFDSILDSAFVIDAEGRIVYCNDAGATFCQSSVRRLIGKALLTDLIKLTEPNILPFTEDSIGRLSPSSFIETEYHVPKAGRSGKVQLAVRPVEDQHWLFFLRDVSLEEALHSKYRSELAQKEDYARNLEKLVEARTAELRSVNKTLNAILDSLGQGFFTFNSMGDCGSVFTKACAAILEGIPKNRKAWDVLGVSDSDRGQFLKWSDSLFKEVLPFDDMKVLGPSLYPHSAHKHVVLDYYPIRKEDASEIADVVVVATDKTAEHQAQIALESERQYASMVVKFLKNKDQFLQFLTSVTQAIEQLKVMAAGDISDQIVAESFRSLHTLEGEAGTFSLRELRQLSRDSQHLLEPLKQKGAFTSKQVDLYRASLVVLQTKFENFLVDNNGIFEVTSEKRERRLEIPVSVVNQLFSDLEALPQGNSLAGKYREQILRVPIGDQLKYYDGLIQSVAERIGKKVKPMQVQGGEIRIFTEPYRSIFSSMVHAFRNAIDHGLETPEDREWAGKDPAGLVQVKVAKEKDKLALTITDDGKGIDPEVIREKLKEKFPEKDFSAQNDEEIVQNVCLPGFSSRDEVGEFSGRGVGLDALREEVLRLGGTIHLKSKVGAGTTIEIVLPELGLEAPKLRSA